MTTEERLDATYGPGPRYSEHHAGEQITYRDSMTGLERTGKILHVFAAGHVLYEGEAQAPIRYVVELGDHGFPEVVEAGQIVQIDT